MIELIQSNPVIAKWIFAISFLMFIGTIVLVPYLITLIPDDYFSHDRPEARDFSAHHPMIRLMLLFLKNLVGYILVILGVAMLVLPGQGILTIVIGLILVDFPKKYQLERWIVSRSRLLRTMNWFRRRASKNPLTVTSHTN
ncbi:MAG: hypothetical protein ACI9XC_000091 [Gammaproteobacteria bacterium]|jgi:hypothetical protein